MHSYFLRLLYYHAFGLLLLAALPWLVFLTHAPETIKALGGIVYFEGFQKMRFPVKHVSENTFWFIRITYPALILLFCALTLAFFREEARQLLPKGKQFLRQSLKRLQQEIRSLTPLEKTIAVITFLLILAERCYYVLQFPIHTDEAASYLLFIRHGPFAITSFYPIPNNHLLQNLLVWPLTFIFNEPFWILRLLPLFFSFSLSFFGFLILKRSSNFLIAYLATALFSFGSLTLFLSTQGRGYILLTLLAVILMVLVFRALQTDKVRYWVLFSFTASLGFFTVPVFAYPFATCLVFAGIFFLIQRKFRSILNLVIAGTTTILGAAVLYLPLLLVSGSDALFANKYLAGLTPELFSRAFLTFLVEVQGELLGGKAGYGVRVFLVATGLLFLIFLLQKHTVFRKQLSGKTTWLAGFCLLMTVLIYIFIRIQLILPPPRVLFFKSFFDYTILAIVLGLMLQLTFRNLKVQKVLAFAGVLVFAGFQISETEAFLKDYPQPYFTSPALNKLILKSGAERVFVEEAFYQLFLEYEFARFQKNIQIENQVSAPGERFDFVVLEHQKPFPELLPDSLYQEVYRDALVRAFVPKN